MSDVRIDEPTLEIVGRAIAASMWGEEQAATFFKIRTRNVHYGLALNAARDALVAYAKANGEQVHSDPLPKQVGR